MATWVTGVPLTQNNMESIKGKKVCVGVTGGIAVYKACEVVSGLRKLGADVTVIMTENATEFVTPLTFEILSNNPVSVGMFDRIRSWEVEHISIAKRSDLFVIAPATANFIGKVYAGIADDMLTTTVMATTAKVLIAPAMNHNMYLNPITQRNIEELKKLGYEFIGPGEGRLANGDLGVGRLVDASEIVEKAVQLLCAK